MNEKLEAQKKAASKDVSLFLDSIFFSERERENMKDSIDVLEWAFVDKLLMFKDGKLVHFLERHHIEGRTAEMIAENLTMAFDEYC